MSLGNRKNRCWESDLVNTMDGQPIRTTIREICYDDHRSVRRCVILMEQYFLFFRMRNFRFFTISAFSLSINDA